jgi:hypothetical protein
MGRLIQGYKNLIFNYERKKTTNPEWIVNNKHINTEIVMTNALNEEYYRQQKGEKQDTRNDRIGIYDIDQISYFPHSRDHERKTDNLTVAPYVMGVYEVEGIRRIYEKLKEILAEKKLVLEKIFNLYKDGRIGSKTSNTEMKQIGRTLAEIGELEKQYESMISNENLSQEQISYNTIILMEIMTHLIYGLENIILYENEIVTELSKQIIENLYKDQKKIIERYEKNVEDSRLTQTEAENYQTLIEVNESQIELLKKDPSIENIESVIGVKEKLDGKDRPSGLNEIKQELQYIKNRYEENDC